MGSLLILCWWFSVLTLTSGLIVKGMENRNYWCPKKFIRSGNSCYYISNDEESWHRAYFKCRDMAGAELAVLDKRWEDRNVKNILNMNRRERYERWIGGIYDWYQKFWIWGTTGKKLRYQGFSRRKPGDDYSWKCIAMDPSMLYRWTTRSCTEKKHYICEVPLRILGEGRKRKQRKFGKGKRKHRRRPPIETNLTL